MSRGERLCAAAATRGFWAYGLSDTSTLRDAPPSQPRLCLCLRSAGRGAPRKLDGDFDLDAARLWWTGEPETTELSAALSYEYVELAADRSVA